MPGSPSRPTTPTRGGSGVRTSRGASGGRFARTTPPTVTHGRTSLRPGAPTRIPLGRGRDRRTLRPVRVPQPRGRDVERARRPAQGAAVRADQPGGQPRGGRQGVLVAPGRHAHPLVRAVPLPVSAGGISLRPAGRRERRTVANPERVRAQRHGDLRRGPVLRRGCDARQGGTDGHRGQCHRNEPRTGLGAPPPGAAAVVPQHLGLGSRRPATPHHAAPPPEGSR